MKKNRLKILANICLIAICFALFALLFISLIGGYKTDALRITISVVSGLFLVFILNSILHELGHAILGVLSGLELYSIKFLFIEFTKDKGEYKFGFSKSQGELGSTILNPKSSKKVAKKYVVSACGGLGATFILLVFQVLVCLASSSLVLYSALGITFPLTVYFFMINLLPTYEKCDGYLVYKYLSGGEDRKIIENYFKATAQLFEGVEPSDLDSTLLVNYKGVSGYSANVRYLRYLAYVKNDEERALKELREISDLSEITNLNDEIFEEIFFSAVLMGDKKFIKAHESSATAVFENSSRPQTYRIHACYRIYNGEKDWAKLILESGIKFCEDYPVKGIAKSEKKYMEILLKNL